METTNLAESDGLSPIEWSRVETELAEGPTPEDALGRHTWLATINADGRPHVTHVGAVWYAGSFWFQTGERTRKAKNVARDPRCTMSVGTRSYDVVIEGDAHRVTDPKLLSEVVKLWMAGGWPAEVDDSGTGITAPFNAPSQGPPPWFVYQITARDAYAVGTTEGTPGSTRWRF